jgi:hypothetical protein
MRDLDPLPGGRRQFIPDPKELEARDASGVRAIDPNGDDYARLVKPYDELLCRTGISMDVRDRTKEKRAAVLESLRVGDCSARAKSATDEGRVYAAVYKLGNNAFYREFESPRSFSEFVDAEMPKHHYIGVFYNRRWGDITASSEKPKSIA